MSRSPDELPLGLSVRTICVIDSSVLITLKSLIGINDQWDFLSHMTELVKSGELIFPRQVARELARVKYPDAPGAWIGSARRFMKHPQPSEEALRRVLSVAEQLIDVEVTSSDREIADPYVAAMACEVPIIHPSCQSVVATEDRIDRPPKISLQTACDRLGVTCWSTRQFIAWANGDESSPDWPGGRSDSSSSPE